MSFKPNKKKVIWSIVITVLWILLKSFLGLIRSSYREIGTGIGSRVSLTEMLISNFLNIIIPFALVYVIWSIKDERINFKFTKTKIIGSSIVAIVLDSFLISFISTGGPVVGYIFNIANLFFFLIILIIVYLIWSLFEKKS